MVARQYPRFHVAFSGTLIHGSRLHQINKPLDLSRKGCRLESPFPAFAGMKVNLLLFIPEDKIPIFIRGATVRWSGSHGIGIEFQSIAPSYQERLNNTIQHIEATTVHS
ncbi:MAG TPA: PilZ domain-containing protein [Nitrospiraceae bacterium]|nr:PilZ domain-containing protein [Nitrospiraceae bacterium]